MTDVAGAPDEAAGGQGRWIFASRLVAQIAQLLIFLVAARFLAPADFGGFALLQAVAAFLAMLAAAGWREYIMATGSGRAAVNHALTLSAISGLIMGVAGLLGAAATHVLAADASLTKLTVVFAGVVLAAPVVASYSGVLVRGQRIAQLSFASIAGELAGLAAAISALVAGWGVVALGLGKLVTQVVILAIAAPASNWRFEWTLASGEGRAIIARSGQILASRAIGFVNGNGATFVIGAFLGAHSLGLYRAAERLVSAVAELVCEPLRTIGWARFSRFSAIAEEDARREAARREAEYLTPLYILVTAPVFVGLALVSEDLVRLALGPQWTEASSVATIFALAALAITPTLLSEPLLSAVGRIDRLPGVLAISSTASIAILAATSPFGLHAAAIASPVSAVVSMTLVARLLARSSGVDWFASLKHAAPVVGALLALATVATLVSHILQSSTESAFAAARLGAVAVAGAGAYVAALAVLRASMLRSALALI